MQTTMALGTSAIDLEATLASLASDRFLARLWAGDATLWTGADEGEWLGWLRLPEPWSSLDFTSQAAERGVRIMPAESFAARQVSDPDAVRVCLGPPRSQATLERALQTLAATLRTGPEPLQVVI